MWRSEEGPLTDLDAKKKKLCAYCRNVEKHKTAQNNHLLGSHMCHSVCVKIRGQPLGVGYSPSTMWDLGIKLRLDGRSSLPTCQALLPAR